MGKCFNVLLLTTKLKVYSGNNECLNKQRPTRNNGINLGEMNRMVLKGGGVDLVCD